MAKFSKYQMLEILWVDIVYDAGWRTPEEAEKFIQDKDMEVMQTGYYYSEDKDNLYIIDSYFKNEKTLGTVHKIPRGCIKKITKK
jgi:hypothetical protein